MSKRVRSECLEAVAIPLSVLIIIFTLEALNLLTPIVAGYALSGGLILFSLFILRRQGRALRTIRLTRRGFAQSLAYSGIFVIALVGLEISRRAIMGEPLLLNPPNVMAERGVYYFLFVGPGEEIWFRGLILFSFLKWKGRKIALLTSSALFGLLHFRAGWFPIIAASALGLVFGAIALKTKNIIGIIISHGFVNFALTGILA